jgi:hypothetical protein
MAPCQRCERSSREYGGLFGTITLLRKLNVLKLIYMQGKHFCEGNLYMVHGIQSSLKLASGKGDDNNPAEPHDLS